jgi:ornithine cyclodeaminase
MMTTLLTREDIAHIARHVGLRALMDRMIEELQRALAAFDPERTIVMPRDGFHYHTPASGLLEWMPTMSVGREITIKLVGYHPENPTTQSYPTILSTLCAFDTANGHLMAVMDGTFATALRTGAASAVASRVLARPDSRILTIIGCGAAAVSQLHALSRVFDFECVRIYDTDPAAQNSFSSRVDFLGLKIEELDAVGLHQAIGASDMLCTATSVGVDEGPVFQDVETQPWLHVNAVGSDYIGKVELPRALVERSTICPDSAEQALLEGECQQVPAEEMGPCLSDLIQQHEQFEPLREQRTVFASTGWALEDQVAMNMLMEVAKELKLGREIQIESIGEDTRDPYGFLRTEGILAFEEAIIASQA